MTTIPDFLTELRKHLDGCPANEVLCRTVDYARKCGRLERVTIRGGGTPKCVNEKNIEIALGANDSHCGWVMLGGQAMEFRTVSSES